MRVRTIVCNLRSVIGKCPLPAAGLGTSRESDTNTITRWVIHYQSVALETDVHVTVPLDLYIGSVKQQISDGYRISINRNMTHRLSSW
jgi:hypothetical protein